MRATNLESRRNADGSVDLRFSTDTEVLEVGLVPEAARLLLAAALQSAPDVMPMHDGFAPGRTEDGRPALMFRFDDRWLSIVLQPLDIETLESVLPRRG